jgi:FkbM family methyltransferase
VKSLVRALLRTYIQTSPVDRGKHWLMENIGVRVGTDTPQRVTITGGAVMMLDITEHVQRWIYYFGVYERETVELFLRLVKPGMTVVDIGANVGQYTLLANSVVGASGSVHAFEANSRNATKLRANLAQNDSSRVEVNAVALSDTVGTVTLYSANNDNAGEHSLFQFDSTMQGEEITAITLDHYVASAAFGSSRRVDVIKIDVQGAEAMVLRGAETTLRTHQPLIICEFEERWLQGMGSSTVELKAWLRSLGYVPYTYDGSRLKEVPEGQVHSLDNLLLVPDSKRAMLASSGLL